MKLAIIFVYLHWQLRNFFVSVSGVTQPWIGQGGGMLLLCYSMICVISLAITYFHIFGPNKRFLNSRKILIIGRNPELTKKRWPEPNKCFLSYFLGRFLAFFHFLSSWQNVGNIKCADDWIRTSDIWCWKRPLF